MSIDVASFKVRFPEFGSVDDARVQFFIDDSVEILNEHYWSCKYDLGLYYHTAHILSLSSKTDSGLSGSSSMVSSKSVDGTSISYSTPSIKGQSDAYYSSTQYGQRYLSLRETLGIAAYVV